MKAIKIKKSVGKAYVFNFNIHNGHKNSYSNTDKTRTEIEHSYNTQIGYKCSEISEVELFETIEEQVPHVVERWYFVVCGKGGDGVHTRKIDEKTDIEILRNEYVNSGYRCSEIKLFREEF